MSSSRRGSIRSDLFTQDGAGRAHHGKNDDTASTNGETGLLRISLDNIKTTLRHLADNGDTQISKLSPALLKNFTDMAEITNLSSTTGYTQVVMGLINDAFANYNRNNITPGTVAAYFKGCLTGDNYGGDPGCSAVCAGSFQPEMITGWTACSENVVHLRNGEMTFQNVVTGEGRAIIHVFDPNVRGFTVSQIKALKDKGINKVAVYHYGTGDYTVRQNHVDIDKLTLLDGTSNSSSSSSSVASRSPKSSVQQKTDGNNAGQKSKKATNYETTNSLSWMVWVVIIFLIVAIALGCYYLNRSGSVTTPKPSTSTQ